MSDSYPPTGQRPPLLGLAEAIKSRASALRRDPCGDWSILGSKGHIYAVPEGFQVFINGWSANGWNRAKKALAFAKVTQDGDDEGGLILDRLPNKDEAALIRRWVGIAKRTEYSEDYRAELRARLKGFTQGLKRDSLHE